MLRDRLVPLCALTLTIACTDADSSPSDTDAVDPTGSMDDPDAETTAAEDESEPLHTYYRDAKVIIDDKCGGCHRPGDIAPFSLTTYEEVAAVTAVLPASIELGSMPPWPPAEDCRPFSHSLSLSEDERALLLDWLDEGAPQGDPADEPPPAPGSEPEPWTPSLTLQMPEPYTPTVEPDDNRCFLVPWPEQERKYMTGYQVVPDNRAIVHHVILFNADADTAQQLRELDEAEPGPGYSCLGGVGAPADWIGSWAPGADGRAMPEGTGIAIEPGSMMVMQVHYNTLGATASPDQTSMEIELADEVERPAATLPFTNVQWVTGGSPMTIPAGEPEVTHSFELPVSNPFLRSRLADIGVGAGDSFLVHSSGLHMHYLGTSASLSVARDGGDDDCMLDIPRWDFDWQGGYTLADPMRVGPSDSLRISCTWDNSPENQPVVDGEVITPQDVQWGEGTTDEMCLGILFVTAE